jgi:hypothetical protein
VGNQTSKLREEAVRCIRVADRTADNKLAAALLAYACELEQRARVIENARKPRRALPGFTEADPHPRAQTAEGAYAHGPIGWTRNRP